jgi:2-hydroxychromene-2-carboxylate isomerase
LNKVELFFDCSSPGTYLCFHRLGELRKELDFDIGWRPIFIGGVFKKVNPGVFEIRATMPPVKDRYFRKNYADWARYTGLRLKFPPTAHPVNSIKAMRGVVVAGRHGKLAQVARATFDAFFGDDLDISHDDVLATVCARAGFDRDIYFQGIADESVKDELRQTTDELIERNGFGSPTMFVNGSDIYFGNDQMELVRAALLRGGSSGEAAAR